MRPKVKPYEIDLLRWYSVSELAQLRMLPKSNNRTGIREMIIKDLNGSNLLKAEHYISGGKKHSKVKGEQYKNFIDFKGYNL